MPGRWTFISKRRKVHIRKKIEQIGAINSPNYSRKLSIVLNINNIKHEEIYCINALGLPTEDLWGHQPKYSNYP
jgi:hypothetical protein